MADAVAYFVQFPHPGREHNPRSNEMPWNTRDHGRKFLLSPGRYIDAVGRTGDAELAFWGEWEAPSRVERPWPQKSGCGMPRALHRPYWVESETSGFRQNTDPWVFGERMVYSNCKQVHGSGRRPTAMQRLTRGSVICFGSTIAQRFCVDTVFVVDSSETWTTSDIERLDVDDAFMACAARPVADSEANTGASFTLYRGASDADPFEGMFSFVPARRVGLDDWRFARSALRSDFINPESTQSPWGSRRPLSIEIVRGVWNALRAQVFDAGHLLGVWLQTPAREDVDLPLGVSGRQRC